MIDKVGVSQTNENDCYVILAVVLNSSIFTMNR
jgi:hypothetical protein